MLVCPNCSHSVDITSAPHCVHCDWRAEVIDGVPILISQLDKSDPILGHYFTNYDQIATDDLGNAILDPRYVKHQVTNMARYVGDVQGSDVLDLGCGQGMLARALAAGGARTVVAADISMDYLRRLVGFPSIVPILANAESLPFRSAFDVLTSVDVMEHVLNVGSFLVSVNQALRRGGRVAIRVPLVENLLSYAAQSGCKYRFVHLRTFDKRLLVSALEGAGFEVLSFHIDGFSIQTPQPFWTKGIRRKQFYNKLSSWLGKHLRDPSIVTTWNSNFASLFMRPQEIVVVGRKIFDISVQVSVP